MTQTPGSGLTYAELSDLPSDSPIRKVWDGLGTMAHFSGIATSAPGGYGRIKTIDEFLLDLADVIPEGATPEAVAHASLRRAAPPQTTSTYEVRHLSPADGDEWDWVVFETTDTIDDARNIRDFWAKTSGYVLIIEEVTTTVQRNAFR